jgi:DNA-binding response OmpR family regulator
MSRVLVVEDQPNLLRSIVSATTEAGFVVVGASTLAETTEHIKTTLDLIILDGSGLEWLKGLRSENNDVPVLLLTARDSIEDRVKGLDCGADDYLIKPFSIDELLARVRALLRRRLPEPRSDIHVLQIQDIQVDLMSRTVLRGGRSIELQPI